MSKIESGFECILILLILGAIALVFKAIEFIIIAVLAILGLFVAYKIIQAIYYLFNPAAKKASIEKKREESEELRRKEEREEKERIERKLRKKEDNRRHELERQRHRDSDRQESPYTYQIGTHGNESLAIRYGIANNQKKVKEYWYHAKGGEKKRNPERDKVYYEPATTIRLQKTQKLGIDLYEVQLTGYRNRKAKVIVEVGTEYVKTFYPYEEDWFDKHSDLEQTLKGNGTFNLKELATFHVQKTVGT